MTETTASRLIRFPASREGPDDRKCVKHQPEPIRKASPEVAQTLLTCAPGKLLNDSPLLADTIQAPRVPLYG
jgi:hypothetical protein